MQLLIVRHAIAEDPAEFARQNPDDAQRPLTTKGIRRMRQAARGLRRLEPGIDLLASSPLLRARQTAEILHQELPSPSPRICEALTPGSDPEALCQWLAGKDARMATLVGHEPDLSELIAWLTTGQPLGFVHFKKGAACLLEFSGTPERGRGEILWLMPSRQLRLLGEPGA